MTLQKAPHRWLRLGIPLFLSLLTIIVYQQEALAAALSDDIPGLTSTIAAKLIGAFHRHDAPVEKTIWRDGPHDEYLAVCLFVRDQAADMVEWFQHHYYEMGIRRFYVMDDGSDPPLSTYMKDYGIPEEAVDFIHFEKSTNVPQGAQLYVFRNHFPHPINVSEGAVIPSSHCLSSLIPDFCFLPEYLCGKR